MSAAVAEYRCLTHLLRLLLHQLLCPHRHRQSFRNRPPPRTRSCSTRAENRRLCFVCGAYLKKGVCANCGKDSLHIAPSAVAAAAAPSAAPVSATPKPAAAWRKPLRQRGCSGQQASARYRRPLTSSAKVVETAKPAAPAAVATSTKPAEPAPASTTGGVCASFTPQAWKKSRCVNCFQDVSVHAK